MWTMIYTKNYFQQPFSLVKHFQVKPYFSPVLLNATAYFVLACLCCCLESWTLYTGIVKSILFGRQTIWQTEAIM